MLGYRSFAVLRARAPGQRRRGALHPDLTWGRSGQGGRIRVTSADLQYLFGIQRSEPDCMTRLVSEHDQPHIRSPRETAAPISRLRRSGLRKTRPFLKTGFFRPCSDAVRPPGSARTDQVLEDLRIRSAFIVRYVSSRLPR